MSWKSVKLGQVLTESKVESITNDPDKRITVRLNIKGVEKRPYEDGVAGGTKYYVRKAGQFIYGKQNLFKGAFGIIPKELDNYESSSDLPCFDIAKECFPEWVFYYFKQGNFYKSTESISTGTGSRRVQPSKLFEIDIPLPSVKEQKAVIQKCVHAENEHEKLLKEIDSQLSNIQLLRQAILQEAVQGKLVPQDPKDEPASELLRRIKAEKAKQAKNGKTETYEPITDVPYEIPNGWVWCRLGEVSFRSYAGKSYKCSERSIEENEWGVLKMSAISSGIFIESENKFLSKSPPSNIDALIRINDLLFARASGSRNLTGVCAVVNSISSNVLLNDKTIRFVIKDLCTSVYISFINNSKFGRLYYENIMGNKTTTMNNITREQFNNLLIPLPPLNEQKHIIAKVQQLMQLCDELEAQVQQSKVDAEKLLQAVLREAFAGKKIYNTQDAQLSMAAEP